MTNIAVCQLTLRIGDIVANRRITTRAALDAIDQGADIVVLPELANTGYHLHDRAEALALAEPVTGATVTAWHEIAQRSGAVIIGGLCELDDQGQARNSSVIVDSTGIRDVYRKTHLWDLEKEIFAPGDEHPRVIDTVHGRLATLICYDIEFPEWVRLAALAGAELIAAPTNWPRVSVPQGERSFLIANVQAMAAANHIFVAAADRAVEAERGHEFTGGSVIVGPDGYLVEPMLENGRSGIVLASCDLSSASDKTLGAVNDSFGDRRVELYEGGAT